jgi:hypothetical protein
MALDLDCFYSVFLSMAKLKQKNKTKKQKALNN